MTTRTWLITGTSRGFGRALAEYALDRGDQVAGTVRSADAVADLTRGHPQHFLPIEFDVRDTDRSRLIVEQSIERFGRVDVLVNNAGRGVIGAAEEVSAAELRDLMDLHFFGPAALVLAALPAMRRQGQGTIVQMSSQGGRLSFPGAGGYSATKFALEGWSEALAAEVEVFGVGVMIVEPSRFRTSFNTAGTLGFAEESETYREMLAPVRANMNDADGRQEGDPDRAAEIIWSLVQGGDVPLRLPLGREAVDRITRSHHQGLEEVARWTDLAVSADFAGVAPSDRPF